MGDSQVELIESIHNYLVEKGLYLSVAESCTGGLLGSMLTERAGSSHFFEGGIIAYQNKVKIQKLGVSEEILNLHGAVSREVAEAMALGCRSKFNTDYALSITGIAGPGGGSEEKPVGTVWIALSSKDKLTSQKILKIGDRQAIRLEACFIATQMLRKACF